ncbi:MAG: SDR family oxidoreductase [Candidatus Eremiobacteraeota bacterium]|nr:SDR family oxidoreductase [Candidatus Eremiobacteraeota bacterium]
MSEIAEKVVVITGASSGIGEATARLLGQRGARLMVGARRTERLEKLVEEIRAAGGTAEFQAVDVTQREDVEALVARAEKVYGQVDVLVNNAGLMPLSNLDRLLVDEWDRMIDVNVKGVLYGIAAALPRMQARKSGHIINLSSIGGHQVVPTAAVYCATKFAVGAISEGLRQEVGRDIRVTVISPGVTESELAHTITDPDAQKGMDEFRSNAIPAEAIARSIAYAIEQPAEVSVSEIIVRPTGGF